MFIPKEMFNCNIAIFPYLHTMKHLLLLASFVILLTFKASAQQSVKQILKGRVNAEEPALTAKEATKLIGKEVYVADTVYNCTTINDSLKVLYLGNKKPKQALAILLKGNKIKTDPKEWVGNKIHVSGNVILYKNSPAIVVTDTRQLGMRIQI